MMVTCAHAKCVWMCALKIHLRGFEESSRTITNVFMHERNQSQVKKFKKKILIGFQIAQPKKMLRARIFCVWRQVTGQIVKTPGTWGDWILFSLQCWHGGDHAVQSLAPTTAVARGKLWFSSERQSCASFGPVIIPRWEVARERQMLRFLASSRQRRLFLWSLRPMGGRPSKSFRVQYFIASFLLSSISWEKRTYSQDTRIAQRFSSIKPKWSGTQKSPRYLGFLAVIDYRCDVPKQNTALGRHSWHRCKS